MPIYMESRDMGDRTGLKSMSSLKMRFIQDLINYVKGQLNYEEVFMDIINSLSF